MHQLNADDEGLDSTDQEKHQGRDDVENAKPFVIDSGQPLMKLVNPRLGVCLTGGNGDHIG
jgi:hypothetical protein